MYDLSNVKVGSQVFHLYETASGKRVEVEVFDVVSDEPKRLVIRKGTVEFDVEKKTGKIIGYDVYVRQVDKHLREAIDNHLCEVIVRLTV